MSLKSEACLSTLIGLNGNELHYYPFMVSLDRSNRGCSTFDDLPSRTCVPNKTEDVNLNVFNMIAKISESKTLTKHVSCNYKCKIW